MTVAESGSASLTPSSLLAVDRNLCTASLIFLFSSFIPWGVSGPTNTRYVANPRGMSLVQIDRPQPTASCDFPAVTSRGWGRLSARANNEPSDQFCNNHDEHLRTSWESLVIA
jgi:hypothetical protein